MYQLLLILILLSAPLESFSSAFPKTYHSKNQNPADYQILVTDETSSTIDEQTFISLPYIILSLYYEKTQEQKRSIEINNDWIKPYFTAWASQENSLYFINFWGGLARIPEMNSHAWVFTVCHELGHILAGEPRIPIDSMRWASAEGMSDHFATTECMPRYYQAVNNLKSPVKNLSISELNICKKRYSDKKSQEICENILSGGVAFVSALHYMKQGSHSESYATPSTLDVDYTLNKAYPSVQCRLDAFRLGALCFTEPGSCKKLACWYSE